MPTTKMSQFPPPSSWEEFEVLLCDLFQRIWNDPSTKRNGRAGQPQHGVDIFGRPGRGIDYAGVQAKKKGTPNSALAVVELKGEVTKAEMFVPKLSEFIVATTAPRDVSLQQEARLLTTARTKAGAFGVDVWGWEDVQLAIAEHPDLIDLHYPQFVREDSATSKLVHLVEQQAKWAAERDRPKFERIQNSMGTLESAFSPKWSIHQSSGEYVANLEWRFRGPRFPMEWRAASGSALDRTGISATFDLRAVPGEDAEVGENELGLEIRFPWRGRIYHELHRWRITRRELPGKASWDVGDEILPVKVFESPLGD